MTRGIDRSKVGRGHQAAKRRSGVGTGDTTVMAAPKTAVCALTAIGGASSRRRVVIVVVQASRVSRSGRRSVRRSNRRTRKSRCKRGKV